MWIKAGHNAEKNADEKSIRSFFFLMAVIRHTIWVVIWLDFVQVPKVKKWMDGWNDKWMDKNFSSFDRVKVFYFFVIEIFCSFGNRNSESHFKWREVDLDFL